MNIDKTELELYLSKARRLIREHIGPDEAITMTSFLLKLKCTVIIPNKKYDQPRLVRALVKQLRTEGIPIVHSRYGYFIAETYEQIETEARWFRSRGLSAFRQEAALRKIPLSELFEQYKLEFQEIPRDTAKGKESGNTENA